MPFVYTYGCALEQIQLEKRVLISWQGKELKGTVKNQREVVGIDLDEAYGDSDGSLDEKRYFDCPEFHGLFVPPASLLSVEVEKLRYRRRAFVLFGGGEVHRDATLPKENLSDGASPQ